MALAPGNADVEADNLDGGGWVVVDESMAPTRRSPADELALKKRVWQLRIAQRKPIAKVAALLEDEEDLDEATIEAYTVELERLRSQVGTHWTWFEEELKAGRHDAQLLEQPGAANGDAEPQAPPEAGDRAVFPGLGAGQAKHSLTAVSRFAPNARGKQAVTERKVNKVQMPCQEVWMAAKLHRKSNFFGAAVIGTVGGSRALFSVLVFTEVGDAVNLGLASRGFSGELLYAAPGGAAEDVWRRLGANLESSDLPGDSGEAPPFSGDPAFSVVTWARRRAFVRRVVSGQAKPMAVVDPLHELTSTSAVLGPFLSEGSRCTSSSAKPDSLLVCDGRQLFHVVDIERRRSEQVAVDRFHSGKLRSSLGAHPQSVTSSWPLQRGKHCEALGGVLAVRSAAMKGNPKDAAAAFQWLELPKFGEDAAATVEPAKADAKHHAAPSGRTSPPAGHCSPQLGPSDKPGKKVPPSSPEAGPSGKHPHGKKAHGSSPASASHSLLRTSVPKDRIAVALKAHGESGGHASSLQVPQAEAPSVAIEAVWPLPGGRVLLLVRDAPREKSASATPQRSPAFGSARSPLGGPKASPTGGPRQSPAHKPSSPQGSGFSLSRQLSPMSFELPSALQREVSPENDPLAWMQAGCKVWLQLWEVPEGHAPAAAPEPLASVSLASPVTALDYLHVNEGAEEGADELLLLCGLGAGGAELRALAKWHAGEAASVSLREVRAWAGEASEGPATHVLLRPCAAAGAGGTAVVAQVGCVRVHKPGAKTPAAAVLPAKGFETMVRVMGLRAIGARGFAACTEQHVYAFEVRADGSAELTAVVSLPRRELDQTNFAFTGSAVRSFQATPYEFFVVLSESEASSPEQNAICGLWPWTGDSEVAMRWNRPGSGRCSRHASSRSLCAWTRRQSGAKELVETKTVVLCLNSTLLKDHQSPVISTLALHNPAVVGGVRGGGGCGSGLLALAAPGPGVSVFWWGVEASPEIQRWRERRRHEVADEARRHELEHKRFKLQRLRQRLEETEKLEEKLKEQGKEALTEEEHAKIQRKPQVEIEIDRLTYELGEERENDEDSEVAASEDSETDLGNEYLNSGGRDDATDKQRRRHEKEMAQKAYQENKRCMQKERRKNRDTKFKD